MDLWTRIEQAREKWNVLQHPFYQRWSAGELTLDELAVYSGQYRRATEAVASMSANLAEDAPEAEVRGLGAHAREEADHVAMWDGFVEAVGGNAADQANRETTECFDIWTKRDGFGPQLARLYAVESGQPEISKTKAMGLSEFYGIEGDPADTYFTVHATMDVEHAEEGRKLIEKYIGEFDEDELVAAAEEAFEANWRLLDGVSTS